MIPIHRGYDINSPRTTPGTAAAADGGKQPPRGMTSTLKPFGDAFHTRIEQRTVLSMTFLKTHPTRSTYIPQLALLYQDARGFQHVISHGIDLTKKCMVLYGSTNAAASTTGMTHNLSSQDDAIEIDGKPAASVMPPPGEQLRKSRIEGGSAMLISVPPPKTAGGGTKANALGGVLILGQRQITYHSTAEGATKVLPIGQALLLSCCPVVEKEGSSSSSSSSSGDEDMLRYLLGDETGRIHLLVVGRKGGLVTNLHFETLGTASVSSALVYLGNGMVFVGSQFANSQLVQILDSPVPVSAVSSGVEESEDMNPLEETTYLQTLEEYTNLGPIVDFDLRPTGDESKDDNAGTNHHRQSVVVTCSGVAKDGTVRLVRNGVGMREQAEVEMEGIKGMWSLRRGFHEQDDTFLVQSFVRETRILGVQRSKDIEMEGSKDDMDDNNEEEEGGALAEVTIGGFNSSKSTLFAGNVAVGGSDLLVQVVEDGVRVVDSATLDMVTDWSPFRGEDDDSEDDEPIGFITVASANESGQIVVALRGGTLVYLCVESNNSKPTIRRVKSVTLEREISCIDLRPFESTSLSDNDAMEVDGARTSRKSERSHLVAVGLWDDFSVRLLNLNESSNALDQLLHINLGRSADANIGNDAEEQAADGGQHMMARSLCLVSMESQSTNATSAVNRSTSSTNKVDMLFVGLGDGKCISFGVTQPESTSDEWLVHSRKEVSLGTQGIQLVPFQHGERACVLATGDRPTVIYLTGGNSGSNSNPKLCYSTISLTVEDDDEEEGHASHRNISVNVAAPFRSSLLFSSTNKNNSSLCVADENTLRLGTIDDVQRLHVTSYKLGMTPRRIAHHEAGRVYCVGCIGGVGAGEGAQIGGEANMGNCVRFFDDSTFEEVNRIDLEPFEMILDITSASLCTTSNSSSESYKPFILIGTAYSYPDEDEPSQGRVLVVECNSGESGNLKSDSEDEMVTRFVRHVTQMPTRGGVYSITPFYGGTVMITVNSKTHLCKLSLSDNEIGELKLVGAGHHGHMISLYCKSLAGVRSGKGGSSGKQLAIVGDLMRSISLVEYLPKHQVIEELARDYNANFCTAIEMLTDNIYLGSENFANLFVLRHNADAPSEEARARLDTIGEYHLGEMINTMKLGSLVMPSNAGNPSAKSDTKTKSDKSSFEGNAIEVVVGSQTLFGTVDGTIGSILGLGGSTFAFLGCLQRAMFAVVRPVGDLSHERHRHYEADGRVRPSRGFIDGDLIESFLDLNRPTMERIVKWMNDDGRWRIRDDGSGISGQSQQNLMDTEEGDTNDYPAQNSLSVEDVLTAVEEISMLH